MRISKCRGASLAWAFFAGMKKLVENVLEILLSLFIVGGLLYVAFYVKPTVTVPEYTPTLFEYRDHYYGVVTPDPAGKTIWAVGNNGRVIRSDNAGQDWHIQDTGTTRDLQSVAAWDSESAIVVGDLATVLTTADGGESWTAVAVEVYEFGDQLLKVCVDPATGQAWISGTMGTVLKSTDRGLSWSMSHPQEDLAWNDIVVAPDGKIWVVGEFGRMQRSADDGASWQEVEAPTAGSSLMAIAFSDPQHAFAVGLSGGVVYSADGGDSWAAVENVTQAHFFDIEWDGQRFAAVGDNGTLASFTADGRLLQVGRLQQDNSLWYTQITSVAPGDYLVAGYNLGRHDGAGWSAYRQKEAVKPARMP
jgi:photosystem II stability/assembly factor-like uncharacterized protein